MWHGWLYHSNMYLYRNAKVKEFHSILFSLCLLTFWKLASSSISLSDTGIPSKGSVLCEIGECVQTQQLDKCNFLGACMCIDTKSFWYGSIRCVAISLVTLFSVFTKTSTYLVMFYWLSWPTEMSISQDKTKKININNNPPLRITPHSPLYGWDSTARIASSFSLAHHAWVSWGDLWDEWTAVGSSEWNSLLVTLRWGSSAFLQWDPCIQGLHLLTFTALRVIRMIRRRLFHFGDNEVYGI